MGEREELKTDNRLTLAWLRTSLYITCTDLSYLGVSLQRDILYSTLRSEVSEVPKTLPYSGGRPILSLSLQSLVPASLSVPVQLPSSVPLHTQ